MNSILIIQPIIALLSTVAFVWATIKCANYFNLKEANDERKVHTEKVSALGGIGIFLGTWAAMFLSNITMCQMMIGLLGGGAALFATGLIDDVICLSAKSRLGVQLAVGLMAFCLGLNFQFLMEMPMWLDAVLTVLFFATIINAFNLIDGINGLSGSLAVLAMIAFTMFFVEKESTGWALISLILGASYLGFLFFNFGKKAKIFMGDNGSTVIGFTIGMLFLIAANASPTSGSEHLFFILLVAGVAVFDLFAVFFLRITNGKSPFNPDRNHIHHLLVDNGFSHRRATAVLLLSQTVLFVLVKLMGAVIAFPALMVGFGLFLCMRIAFGNISKVGEYKLKSILK